MRRVAVVMFKSKILEKFTHFIKALFYMAKMSSAPYMYKLIRHLRNSIIFNIDIARVFNASL